MTKSSYLIRAALIAFLGGPVLCSAVRAQDPTPQAVAQDHGKRGDSLFSKRKWAEAESEYLQAVYLDPKNPRYHADLAGVSNWLKQEREATAAADQASRLGYKMIDVWRSLGGAKGELGLPTSGERSASHPKSPSHALTRSYERGAIFWYTEGPMKGKAIPIYGVSAEKYLGPGNWTAQLGFPQSTEEDTPESPQGTHGRQIFCERGGIYWHTDGLRSRHAFIVGGGLWRTYQRVGGPGSKLGLPIGDDYGPSDHRFSEFEGGFISWNHGESEQVHFNREKNQTVPKLIDERTPALMKMFHVPGVSAAVVSRHKIVWAGQYGVLRAGSDERMGPHTTLEAASMSKPVFAYVVLKLVEAGKLDLDRPLVNYLSKPYLKDEPLHELITARMVLVHTTGFPNWREGGWGKGGPLHVEFKPGTRFQYSGEGYFYLQHVVEHLTGMPFDRYVQESLLGPLGMADSSYVWRDGYAETGASPHSDKGEVLSDRHLERRANVAYTLYTTPTDYARFLVEMLKVDRTAEHSLKQSMLEQMLTPVRKPAEFRAFGWETWTTMLEQMLTPARKPGEFRALGWETWTTPHGRLFGHSGANRGFRCHARFNPTQGNGLVIMTNSESGSQIYGALVHAIELRFDWRYP
jgi:CubicO group peptidase (beta-lactamase class C family)